jgi:hypothetical protein
VKALWSIWLSLTLAWSLGALDVLATSPAAATSPCPHCNCGGTGCCEDEAPASPLTAPAVLLLPAPPARDLAWRFSALSPLPFALPRVAELGAAGPVDLDLPVVPLRARHCCFLV